MKKTQLIPALNILLIVAMLAHVVIAIALHQNHPEYSTPAYAEVLNAVYYLIPLALLNLGNVLFLRKKQNK